jgi:hypothetical protein
VRSALTQRINYFLPTLYELIFGVELGVVDSGVKILTVVIDARLGDGGDGSGGEEGGVDSSDELDEDINSGSTKPPEKLNGLICLTRVLALGVASINAKAILSISNCMKCYRTA